VAAETRPGKRVGGAADGDGAARVVELVVAQRRRLLAPVALGVPGRGDGLDLDVDDGLDQLAARTAKPDGKQRKIRVTTTDPERQFTLETGDAVTLVPADDETVPELGVSELRLPAEAFVRLIYGRLDSGHTPADKHAGVELDELRAIFPGF